MPLRIRRGTDAERLTITPAEGELIYTTDSKQIYVGDGTTLGGNQIIANASIDNLETNLDLNNFNIVGNGNIIIDGNFITTGNIDGNFIGTVDGDVKGSVFADDSTVLVDGLTGNHYGLFNGNVIGNVTGNLFGDVTGNLTGNVLGDVTGNLTGNVLGNVTGNIVGNLDGFVTGDVKGSVFAADSSVLVDATSGNHYGIFNGTLTGTFNGETNGTHFGPVFGNLNGDVFGNIFGNVVGSVFSDDSSLIIDGINSNVHGNFVGRIDSREIHRVITENETISAFDFFHKTAPGGGRGTSIRLNGYKGSFEAPQEPDNFSRLSLAFRFWDDTLGNYDTKNIVSGFTQSNGSGFMYIGSKKFDGTFTDGIRLDGSDGSISLRNFGRIDLQAPITNIGNLRIETDQIINPTTNQNIKLVCSGTGTVEFSVPTQTTVGAAGPANALPASPDIYIQINVNGVNYVVPAFAVS